MKDLYITIYSEENGRQDLTYREFDSYYKRWQVEPSHRAKYHRIDGPAVIRYSPLYSSAYWIEGVGFTAYEYNETIQEVRDMPLVLRLIDPRKWVREFK